MQNNKPDIVLIGAGIMSATLGILLKELMPNASIAIFERLPQVAAESSDAWNNAGTGHSAFCELNYTPENEDGSIDTSKALKIASQFETSKQFWAYLVKQKYFSDPQDFINTIPHMSFVWGNENVAYLKKRFEALKQHALFSEMQYTEEFEQIQQWIPLVMEGRDKTEKVAATKMDIGTDVNFGVLTRVMIAHLQAQPNVTLYLSHEIKDLHKESNGNWEVKVKDLLSGETSKFETPFVFIGAGGGSLKLLEKSDIDEAEGYGGFPISGQWLKCTNKNIIERHAAKVYGKASVGAPPMSLPHLDTRMIGQEKALLFGPFAGFSTKFLKNGSYLDLPLSLEFDNIIPMLSAGWHNVDLTKYLIKQVAQSDDDRLDALKEYLPEAKLEDWELAIAGQRVQVIKKDKDEGGVLEFGTEIVAAADGSLAALLGASPGASTSVAIMINVLKKCFPTQMKSNEWVAKLKQIIPSYEQSLADNDALCKQVRASSAAVLELG
jgi:malate dehydrogenase (quinone)